MTSEPLEYWKPGDEERRLRIFISHRYGSDQRLYDEVISALYQNGFAVQDISLSASQVMAGPRGGQLPKLEIQAEIAARIYTADIMIAPSRVATSHSQWVTWEVQLAAIGYGIPILFVSERNQRRSTKLVTEVKELELPHAVCSPNAHEIARSAAALVNCWPTWSVRQKEEGDTIRFRGPPPAAMATVLRKLPFQPRLTTPDLPPDPPPKRGIWGIFSGKDHTA
jgi:hypothetical protein